jgi:DNA invertase Pin-like site-specific DNA recombinase
VRFKTLRESLDTTVPGGRLIFDVFAALAELLRELMTERTREGLGSLPGPTAGSVADRS